MAMRRKMMNGERIRLSPPMLEAKNEANWETRIFLATDETQRGQAATIDDEERSLLAVE